MELNVRAEPMALVKRCAEAYSLAPRLYRHHPSTALCRSNQFADYLYVRRLLARERLMRRGRSRKLTRFAFYSRSHWLGCHRRCWPGICGLNMAQKKAEAI